MTLKKLTKWTPELRQKLFKYRGKDMWFLDEAVKTADKQIKGIRKHGGSGTLEEINYYKAMKQAAQDELNRLRDSLGTEKYNEALQPKSTNNYKMRY